MELTKEEREQGLAELKAAGVTEIELDDIRYFREKLYNGLRSGRSEASLEKTRKQLALLEDAAVIYKLTRPGDNIED